MDRREVADMLFYYWWVSCVIDDGEETGMSDRRRHSSLTCRPPLGRKCISALATMPGAELLRPSLVDKFSLLMGHAVALSDLYCEKLQCITCPQIIGCPDIQLLVNTPSLPPMRVHRKGFYALLVKRCDHR